MATIALITDFGVQDTYVGVVKGVIAGINPTALVIDVTHAVAPQDIRGGAFALLTSHAYFPDGTVFVVVVDPGVGSARRALAVRAGAYQFVGPDNGVLSYVLRHLGNYQAYALTNHTYTLQSISSTFHGRDIFAPAAAHLAAGTPASAFGMQVERITMLSDPLLIIDTVQIRGEVIHVDHYGNVVTSIGMLSWRDDGTLALDPMFTSATDARVIIPASVRIAAGETEVLGIVRHYSAAERGAPLALVGSSGFLELAVNAGNAAGALHLHIGTQVNLQIG